MNQLIQIAYVSTAAKLFNGAELRTMLKEANERNTQSGITGMLLYKDGQFMQILEGPEEPVKATFGRISNDPRHHGIIVLIKESVNQCHYPGWSMAFRNLNLPDHQDVSGYSEFLNTPLNEEEFTSNPSRCEKFMLLFKKNIR